MRILRILGVAALGLLVMTDSRPAASAAGRSGAACAARPSARWWAGAKARRKGPRSVS